MASCCNLLGIRQVVVARQQDGPGRAFAAQRFDEIRDEYTPLPATSIGVDARLRHPGLGPRRRQHLRRASATMPWYDGPTVMEALDSFRPTPRPTELPLRLPIQDVYKFDDRRILAGRIESGRAARSATACCSRRRNKTARVASIEALARAGAGRRRPRRASPIGLTLDDQLFVERGEIASHGAGRADRDERVPRPLVLAGPCSRCAIGDTLPAASIATRDVPAIVQAIERDLRHRRSDERARRDEVPRHGVADVILRTPRHAGARRGRSLRAHRPLRPDATAPTSSPAASSTWRAIPNQREIRDRALGSNLRTE